MDVALKQRLVGALVLVALGVIFIPMILDGSAQRVRDGASIDIPERPERNFETRRLALNPDDVPPEQAPDEAPSVEQPDNSAVPEVVVASEDSNAPDNTVLSTPSEDDEDAGEGRDTDLPTAVKQPAEQPATTPSDPEPAETTPGVTGWALQLGSFGKQDNAAGLVARVREMGISAYSEAVAMDSGNTLYRVRAGAFASEEDALEAGDVITAALPNVEASLRRLTAGEEPESDPPLEGYMVQVGSFKEASNATGLRDRLRRSGFSAHMDQAVQRGGTRFRVRVGPEILRADAEELQRELKRKMKLNGIVVSHP